MTPDLRATAAGVTAMLVVFAGVITSGVVVYRRGGRYGERFSPDEAYMQRIYDQRTRTLRVVEFDRNHNGRPDRWTYFENDRMVRTEADEDEDGLIDHWYYYDKDENVVRMGMSTRHDGVCDAWWYDGPESGTHRIEYTDRASARISRVEYFVDDRLVRVDDRSRQR